MTGDVHLYRLGCGAALVAGPALFFIDNVLHPEEFTRGHEAEQLAEIAADPALWQAAHMVGFGALMIFAAALLGLAYAVRGRLPRLGLGAGLAAVAGLMGLAFAFALDGYTWGVLGEVYRDQGADPATVELALHEVQESGWAVPYYALTALWAGAMVALCWGAARVGTLAPAPAAALAAATIAVGLEGVVQDNTYFIASSALLLIAGAWSAVAILRSDEASFAPGRA